MNSRFLSFCLTFWASFTVRTPCFKKLHLTDPFFNDFTSTFQKSLFKDFPDGGTIVDIGCGSGRGMRAIQKLLGYFLIGVDVSEEALQHVADNLLRHGRSVFSRFWYVLATKKDP